MNYLTIIFPGIISLICALASIACLIRGDIDDALTMGIAGIAWLLIVQGEITNRRLLRLLAIRDEPPAFQPIPVALRGARQVGRSHHLTQLTDTTATNDK